MNTKQSKHFSHTPFWTSLAPNFLARAMSESATCVACPSTASPSSVPCPPTSHTRQTGRSDASQEWERGIHSQHLLKVFLKFGFTLSSLLITSVICFALRSSFRAFPCKTWISFLTAITRSPRGRPSKLSNDIPLPVFLCVNLIW